MSDSDPSQAKHHVASYTYVRKTTKWSTRHPGSLSATPCPAYPHGATRQSDGSVPISIREPDHMAQAPLVCKS